MLQKRIAEIKPYIFDKDMSIEFFKLIHDFNQDFKGLGSDMYYVTGINIMCFDPSSQMTQVYGTLNRDKKTAAIYDILIANDFSFAINGKEFFAFQKEYKKNVTEIELTGYAIIIKTDIPGIGYIGSIKDGVARFDKNMEFFDDLDIYNPKDPTWQYDLTYEMYTEMKELRTSFTLYLHTEIDEITINKPKDEYYMPLRFNQKFLTSFKKTTKGTVYMWESGYDDSVFVICFHLENKKFDTYSYIKAVFFGE